MVKKLRVKVSYLKCEPRMKTLKQDGKKTKYTYIHICFNVEINNE